MVCIIVSYSMFYCFIVCYSIFEGIRCQLSALEAAQGLEKALTMECGSPGLEDSLAALGLRGLGFRMQLQDCAAGFDLNPQ